MESLKDKDNLLGHYRHGKVKFNLSLMDGNVLIYWKYYQNTPHYE